MSGAPGADERVATRCEHAGEFVQTREAAFTRAQVVNGSDVHCEVDCVRLQWDPPGIARDEVQWELAVRCTVRRFRKQATACVDANGSLGVVYEQLRVAAISTAKVQAYPSSAALEERLDFGPGVLTSFREVRCDAVVGVASVCH
jgi:hypothetical protein